MAHPNPIKAGSKAPPFNYTNAGENIQSSDINGRCLLYFYPKDDTPGCTKEACALRDSWSDLLSADLTVVGVSKDSMVSHEKFIAKYQLPFPLIADTELELARAYGVYGEKKFMGRVYDSVHRMSFLIASDGTILKTYDRVKPEQHAAQVLEDLKAL
jgi:peroxiredoxin Q/BCP